MRPGSPEIVGSSLPAFTHFHRVQSKTLVSTVFTTEEMHLLAIRETERSAFVHVIAKARQDYGASRR